MSKRIKACFEARCLLAITIQPKDKWEPNVDTSIMTLYFGRDVVSIFSDAGFRNIRVEVPPQEDKISIECILGVK